MAHDLTIDQLSKALPKALRGNATQELVDKVNNLSTDPLVREAYRENILSYTKVMSEGRFQIGNYIEAVKYITHKVMGDTNLSAYRKTFPDRYKTFLNNGTSSKDIASYVTSYNKNKLVNLVREQTLIPTYILNADYYQKALNTQMEIMADKDVNARDRTAAANSILTHLKVPEATKVELDIGLKTDSVISDLRSTMVKLAGVQQKVISDGGATPKDIAESSVALIEGEVVDE
jgi:hypothetical protein